MSTQIANKSFKKDEIDIAEYLHAEDIEFNASDITYNSKYIKINKINNIIIKDIKESKQIGNNSNDRDYSLLTPIIICVAIVLLLFFIGDNLYKSYKKPK